MFSLQQAASAVTEAAGWREAVPDAQGVFHFALEDGLQMDLFSPDGQTAVFLADLGALPENGEERERTLRHVASRSVAAMKKRSSILSLTKGRLTLHRLLRFAAAERSDAFPEAAKEFLNDLTWWRNQVSGGQARSDTASPYSMPSFWGGKY